MINEELLFRMEVHASQVFKNGPCGDDAFELADDVKRLVWEVRRLQALNPAPQVSGTARPEEIRPISSSPADAGPAYDRQNPAPQVPESASLGAASEPQCPRPSAKADDHPADAGPKWCSYCRKVDHNDSECWSTRPAGWSPKSYLDISWLRESSKEKKS